MNEKTILLILKKFAIVLLSGYSLGCFASLFEKFTYYPLIVAGSAFLLGLIVKSQIERNQ